MKLHWTIALAALLVLPTVVGAQDDASAGLARAYEAGKHGLASVRWTINNGIGDRPAGALGICIGVDEQGRGILATMGMDGNIPLDFFGPFSVVVPGGKELKATLLGLNPTASMGFVRVEDAYEWRAMKFAKQADLSVGDRVFSVGLLAADMMMAPYAGTGLVSSDSTIPERTFGIVGGGLTTVGSPVFNSDGKVVGVVGRQMFVSAQLYMQRQAVPVLQRGQHWTSYFLAVDEFAYALADIPTTPETPEVPWLGALGVEGVPENLWEMNRMTGPGVKLHTLVRDANGNRAGLLDGDIIVAVNGEALPETGSPEQLASFFVRKIARMGVGKTVDLDVLRGGKGFPVTVDLEAWPERPGQTRQFISQELALLVREKVELDKYYDKTPTGGETGLFVVQVSEKGPAGVAGVEMHDTIRAVNGEKVTTVDSFSELVNRSVTQGKPMEFSISRGGENLAVTVQATPQQAPGAFGP